jgi:hypothetical protein
MTLFITILLPYYGVLLPNYNDDDIYAVTIYYQIGNVLLKCLVTIMLFIEIYSSINKIK